MDSRTNRGIQTVCLESQQIMGNSFRWTMGKFHIDNGYVSGRQQVWFRSAIGMFQIGNRYVSGRQDVCFRQAIGTFQVSNMYVLAIGMFQVGNRYISGRQQVCFRQEIGMFQVGNRYVLGRKQVCFRQAIGMFWQTLCMFRQTVHVSGRQQVCFRQAIDMFQVGNMYVSGWHICLNRKCSKLAFILEVFKPDRKKPFRVMLYKQALSHCDSVMAKQHHTSVCRQTSHHKVGCRQITLTMLQTISY